jgi:hypothetical protein
VEYVAAKKDIELAAINQPEILYQFYWDSLHQAVLELPN